MKFLPMKLTEVAVVLLVVAAFATPSVARNPEMLNGPSMVGFEGDPTGGVIGIDGEIWSGGDSNSPQSPPSDSRFVHGWWINPQNSLHWSAFVLPIPVLSVAEDLHLGLPTTGGISRCR